MLVVNRYTLVAVHLLNFLYEVHLCFARSLDLHQFFWIEWAFGEALASIDVLAIFDDQATAGWKNRFVLDSFVVDDFDRDSLAVVFENPHHAIGLGETRRPTRVARLEQLYNARQSAGDVFASNTTSMECAHRQLGTRLTDRLGGDYAYRLTQLD